MNFKNLINKFKYGISVLLKPFKMFIKDKNIRQGFIYNYFSNNLKIDEKMVLLETSHGEKIGGNPYAIYLEMIKDNNFSRYKYVFVLNNKDPFYNRYLKNKKKVKIVKRNSVSYLKYLAISKYLINDTTFHFYFSKREKQIYINTWHGTPVKTLGKDVKGTLGQQKNAIRNFLHTDFLIHPNNFTSNIINSSHDLNGIYQGKNILSGYPRVDLTINANKNEIKDFLQSTLGIKLEKKIILYAPTWRGELGKSENLNEELLMHVREMQSNLPEGYTLLLKVHNLSYQFIKNDKSFERICVPNWFETNELLSIVDILITDYSSIFFDFLHTKRPVLFFAYDLEKYKQERGMYLDIKNITGEVCESVDELISKFKNIDSLNIADNKYYLKSIDDYCSYDNGQASSRVIKEISKDYTAIAIKEKKKKIVLYAGSMVTNGVTVSLLNMLSNLDYSKYDITLLHGGHINKDNKNNLLMLPENVKVVYRMGSYNFSLLEYYINDLLLAHGFKWNFIRKYFPFNLYKKEMRRLVGNTTFDIAIDYCGYSPMWSAILASSDASKKVMYLHSEMKTDVEKRAEKNFKVKINFNIIFNLYHMFDKLISVSEDVHQINKENLKQYSPEENFTCVPNPINYNRVKELANCLDLWHLNSRDYLVLKNYEGYGKADVTLIDIPKKENINFITIGRLTNEKDQQKLIKAFKQINEKYNNTKLYIVGEGYLKDELLSLTSQLQLDEKIIFTGAMSNPFALLNFCDCFVLSSNYEGQGLVILESLILGKSVISTDIKGPRGILKDGYGILVENSIDGLINGMEKFIIQGDSSSNLFDFEEYNVRAMERFYKEVIHV